MITEQVVTHFLGGKILAVAIVIYALILIRRVTGRPCTFRITNSRTRKLELEIQAHVLATVNGILFFEISKLETVVVTTDIGLLHTEYENKGSTPVRKRGKADSSTESRI